MNLTAGVAGNSVPVSSQGGRSRCELRLFNSDCFSGHIRLKLQFATNESWVTMALKREVVYRVAEGEAESEHDLAANLDSSTAIASPVISAESGNSRPMRDGLLCH